MLSSSVSLRFASSFNLKPLGNRIVVEVDKSQKDKIGSLYIPESAQQPMNQAIIKAAGPGATVDGKLIPMTLKVGQRILMPQYGGQVVKIDKTEYTILSEEDVLAVFE